MSVAWRFDGKFLASGGADNKIMLWDPEKGERLKTLEGHRLAKLFVSPAHLFVLCHCGRQNR